MVQRQIGAVGLPILLVDFATFVLQKDGGRAATRHRSRENFLARRCCHPFQRANGIHWRRPNRLQFSDDSFILGLETDFNYLGFSDDESGNVGLATVDFKIKVWDDPRPPWLCRR
jgi:hypothetical protein